MMKLFFGILSLLLANLGFAASTGDGLAVSRIPLGADTAILTPAQALTSVVAPNNEVIALLENQALAANSIRLNPRAVDFVTDYIGKNTRHYMDLKDWGRPYFKLMDEILVKYGLPTELKYLAVIESKLQSGAVSWAGAAGPWQLMPATARGMGLKVMKGKDERKDYYKSTNAAAKYLKYLFSEFQDWLLVIAAYNGGPGYVYNAIKKSKSRDFWELQHYLPVESRNHVKKFIAAHYIFEGQGGITTLTKEEATEQIGALAGYLFNRKLTGEELNSSKTTTISGKYSSVVIAKYINMDVQDFNRYNPEFDKLVAGAENEYELKLPAPKMDLFIANKYPILNESVQRLLTDNTDDMLEVKATASK